MIFLALGAFDPHVVVVVLLAAILRGFSGFGFSLAAVPALSLIMPLNAAVPLALGLEAVGVLPSVGRIKGQAAYPVLWRMIAAALFSMPIGLLILKLGTPSILKPAVSVFVLVAVVLIWKPRDLVYKGTASKHYAHVAGVISGILNGAAAMSGPPIILFMLSSAYTAEQSRATMMMFFSVSAIVTLMVGITTGVYDPPSPGLFLWCVPFLALGVEVGTLCRKLVSTLTARRWALVALAVSASTSLVAIVHLH